MKKSVLVAGVLLIAGCFRVPPAEPPAGAGAPVKLCNDTGAGLHIGLNWQAPQQVPAGRCVGVRAQEGPTLIRAFVWSQPPDRLFHPAARVDLPKGGAVIRYGMRGEFIVLKSVEGTKKWSRCNYPGGMGPSEPDRRSSPLWPRSGAERMWRAELDQWMRVNLICSSKI